GGRRGAGRPARSRRSSPASRRARARRRSRRGSPSQLPLVEDPPQLAAGGARRGARGEQRDLHPDADVVADLVLDLARELRDGVLVGEDAVLARRDAEAGVRLLVELEPQLELVEGPLAAHDELVVGRGGAGVGRLSGRAARWARVRGRRVVGGGRPARGGGGGRGRAAAVGGRPGRGGSSPPRSGSVGWAPRPFLPYTLDGRI